MNNRLKHFAIVMAASISIFSCGHSVFVGNPAVYAASYKLNSLDVEGATLYENKNYTKEISSSKNIQDEYYARLSSDRSKITVNADSESGYIEIVKSKGKRSYRPGDDIPILAGNTTLYIKVYESEDDREKQKNSKREYRINIKRYTQEEEKESLNDYQEKVYLQSIELDYGDVPVSFRFDKMKYDVDVDKDMKSIAVKAVPDDGAYKVKINSITVDENKDYKRVVELPEDKTEIEITLSYDDEVKRTYKITVNKKDKNSKSDENKTNDGENNSNQQNTNVQQDTNVEQNTSNNQPQNNDNNEEKNNLDNKDVKQQTTDSSLPGWHKVNEKWTCNDDYGNQLKNTWFYDRNYKNTYYFDADGYMKTGWLPINNDWYYLSGNGAMVTGWKQINNEWYYLNYDGKMVCNSTIDGYRLGSNGMLIR